MTHDASTPTTEASSYEAAFFDVARMLGFPAMPISPAAAYRDHVRPRLVELIAIHDKTCKFQDENATLLARAMKAELALAKTKMSGT